MDMKLRVGLILAFSGCLVACGGGSGSSSSSQSTANTNTYNLLTAYKNMVAAGQSNNFSIAGTCGSVSFNNGTASFGYTPASTSTQTTFEGTAALTSTETIVMNLPSCTPTSITGSSTHYYTLGYLPLGYIVSPAGSGANYYDWVSGPNIPSTPVAIGAIGTIGTENGYTDSSKTILSTTDQISYQVVADGSSTTTALLKIVDTEYTGGALSSTEIDTYRINATSTLLTLIGVDMSLASGNHFILQ